MGNKTQTLATEILVIDHGLQSAVIRPNKWPGREALNDFPARRELIHRQLRVNWSGASILLLL
ncbi:MAG: hypothetical protein C0478_07820 [Planctomyces sp.]|nr:hypothetical protein [Planctomyces sp.]